MIITQKKPIEELMAMLGDAKKIALIGCGSCATACATGGDIAHAHNKGAKVVHRLDTATEQEESHLHQHPEKERGKAQQAAHEPRAKTTGATENHFGPPLSKLFRT